MAHCAGTVASGQHQLPPQPDATYEQGEPIEQPPPWLHCTLHARDLLARRIGDGCPKDAAVQECTRQIVPRTRVKFGYNTEV